MRDLMASGSNFDLDLGTVDKPIPNCTVEKLEHAFNICFHYNRKDWGSMTCSFLQLATQICFLIFMFFFFNLEIVCLFYFFLPPLELSRGICFFYIWRYFLHLTSLIGPKPIFSLKRSVIT